MKKLVLVFVALFSFQTAIAEEITLVRGGSDTGTTSQRSNLYTVALEDLGYTVKRPSSMPSDRVAELLLSTSEPVIVPWTSSHGTKIPLDFTLDNFVGLEYSAPLYVCTINEGVEMQTAKVGHARTNPVNAVKKMGYKIFIPYKNNSAAENAALSGEIDMIYTNQKGATKLKKTGIGCTVVPEIAQHMFLLAANVDMDKLRKTFAKGLNHEEFVTWQNNAGVNNNMATGNPQTDFELVKDSYAQWGDL